MLCCTFQQGHNFFFYNLTFELSAEAGVQTRMSSCGIMSGRRHGEQQSQTTVGYADVEPRGQQSASVHQELSSRAELRKDSSHGALALSGGHKNRGADFCV